MFLVPQSFQVHPIAVLTIIVVLASVTKCSSKTSPTQQRRTDGGTYILNQMQSTVDASDRGRYTAENNIYHNT